MTTVEAPDLTVAMRLAPSGKLKAIHFAVIEARIVGADGGEGRLDWDLEKVRGAWSRVENELRVVLPYGLKVSRSEGDETKHVLQVNVVIRLDYELPSDTPSSDVSHFAAIQGCMHAWPYLRAEVQALTTKLDFPPLVLPALLSGHVPSIVTMTELVEAPTVAAIPGASRTKRRPAEKAGARGQRRQRSK